MSDYSLQIFWSCQDFIDGLKEHNPPLHTQLCDTIKSILDDPFASKFIKLKDSEKEWRARSGDYRIVYFVKNGVVFITKIALRKNVYKKGAGCPKFSKKRLRSL